MSRFDLSFAIQEGECIDRASGERSSDCDDEESDSDDSCASNCDPSPTSRQLHSGVTSTLEQLRKDAHEVPLEGVRRADTEVLPEKQSSDSVTSDQWRAKCEQLQKKVCELEKEVGFGRLASLDR